MQFRPSVIDEKKKMIVKISCLEKSGFGRSGEGYSGCECMNSYTWREGDLGGVKDIQYMSEFLYTWREGDLGVVMEDVQ